MNNPLLSTLVMVLLPQGGIKTAHWDRVVTAVALVESGMKHDAVGDRGKSRGAWQITRKAWVEVNKLRRKRKAIVYSWETFATNPTIARVYAEELLSLIVKDLSLRLGRPPTIIELYAGYNLGLHGFGKLAYNVAHIPGPTRFAGQKVNDLCQ